MSFAACTSPAGNEGAFFFNSTSHVPQFCAGTAWQAMGPVPGAGGSGCSTLPAIGTVLADGSVYAGLSTDGSVPMATQRCDIGMSWSGSACTGTRTMKVWSAGNTIVTGYTNADTGNANTLGLYPLSNADSPYTAAITCHSLNEDGHTDWYLPALNELNVLYTNRVAIGNFDTANSYWTSTENDNYGAWFKNFSNGIQSVNAKNLAMNVRCARKTTLTSGPAEGTIIYNNDSHVLQYCDGAAWIPMGPVPGTGLTPPAVGTVMADGSVYAGLSTDGSVPMATQRCDIGMTWSGSACTGTRSLIVWSTGATIATGITNADTGKANTLGLYPLSNADSPYTAAITCHNLNEDGHTDWYLPAENELNVLYTNQAAIGNFDSSSPYYWPSTELNGTNAYILNFGTGGHDSAAKTNHIDVRCVRKSTGACANPPGTEGSAIYNSASHIMQYCDGTNWRGIGPSCAPSGFTDQTNVAPSTLTTSNIAWATHCANQSVSIGGAGSPQYRICSDVACGTVVQNWGSGAGTVNPGQYLQLELTSSASGNTTNSATPTVGGAASPAWNVTTCNSADVTSLGFTNQTHVLTSTLITSNIVQIPAGLCPKTVSAITGTGTPYNFRICSDAACGTVLQTWGNTSQTISPGQYLQLEQTSSASYNTATTAQPTVGGYSGTASSGTYWNVTTWLGYQRVFVSSATYLGNIGSVAAADTDCATLATAASLDGTWKAWISVTTGSDNPAFTFTHPTTPYKLVGGTTTIANNWTGLVGGTILLPINKTEIGAAPSAGNVWTNTSTAGAATTSGSSSTGNCIAWTSSAGNPTKGNYGLDTSAAAAWTASSSQICSTAAHLYCFEQ
jgi:Protein of unknown function (DUF1566)